MDSAGRRRLTGDLLILRRRPYRGCGPAAGFTLLDILVTIVVIGVLVGLLMPSLVLVRETTHRVVCASNVRQIGLAMMMYADDQRGDLPHSRYSDAAGAQGGVAPMHQMLIVRPQIAPVDWDGIGRLFGAEYLDASGVFYCPSHWGMHPFDRYADRWESGQQEIVANYQYRGADTPARRRLASLPSYYSLVSDGLRTYSDYNHRIGANILKADISVRFFPDESRRVGEILPKDPQELLAAEKVCSAWEAFDGVNADCDDGEGQGSDNN